MKILVFGANGMLGNALIRVLSEKESWEVFGTVRSPDLKKKFSSKNAENLIVNCEATNYNDLKKVFNQLNPEVVINCISLSKKLLKLADPLLLIPIYSLLPHHLAKLCKDIDARFIQISSDGVFSGKKGNYSENDIADAQDLYGSAKFLGEVNEPNTITIRTSIIGHELQRKNGIVEWFLSQNVECQCHSREIFSGFPAVVLAQIIRDVIIPKKYLNGLYHIASPPISKCDLLRLIAEVYGRKIKLINNEKFKMNRSLNDERFQAETGYISPDWPELIKLMYKYK